MKYNYVDKTGLAYLWSKLKSVFYKKTEIDTLRKTDGGNYDADLISAAGSIGTGGTVTSFTGFVGGVNYDTDFCIINLVVTTAISAGATATICTLPSGYRPSTAFSDLDAFGNTIKISTAGVVTVTAKAAMTAYSSYIRAYAEW